MCRPVVAREFFAQLRERPQVVGLVAIAQLRAIPHLLGQFGLQRHDGFGAGLGLAHPGKTEHGRHMFQIRGADLHETWFRVEIEILVGQTQAAHADPDQIAVRVLAIERDVAADRAVAAVHAGPAERSSQCSDRIDAGDPRQGRFQRGDTGRIARGGVHVAGVEVADFLFVAARRQILARQQFLDDRAGLFFGLIAQCVERSVAGVVVPHLIRIEPAAVGVAVEIVARLYRQIAIVQRNAEAAQLRPCSVVGEGCGCGDRKGNA